MGGDYLIEGVLPADALAWLHGTPNSGKSYVALDWALSVAIGQPWANRAVATKPVAYGGGPLSSDDHIAKRKRMWVARHLPNLDDLHEWFFTHGSPLPTSDAVHSDVAKPGLVVCDLEHDSRNVATTLANGLDGYRKKLGGTVLVVCREPPPDFKGAPLTVLHLKPAADWPRELWLERPRRMHVANVRFVRITANGELGGVVEATTPGAP